MNVRCKSPRVRQRGARARQWARFSSLRLARVRALAALRAPASAAHSARPQPPMPPPARRRSPGQWLAARHRDPTAGAPRPPPPPRAWSMRSRFELARTCRALAAACRRAPRRAASTRGAAAGSQADSTQGRSVSPVSAPPRQPLASSSCPPCVLATPDPETFFGERFAVIQQMC